jgi:hypothetical protein
MSATSHLDEFNINSATLIFEGFCLRFGERRYCRCLRISSRNDKLHGDSMAPFQALNPVNAGHACWYLVKGCTTADYNRF